MNKIITSIEHITRSKQCRVVFSKSGRHLFGGNSTSIKYKGIQPPAPIHHIFTLDMDDDFTPIRFSSARYLPLIFPLSYSSGGGEISYRLTAEDEIEIISLSDYSSNDEPYFLLHELPERKAKLKPMSYTERRILESNIRDWSYFDKRRMKRLWNGECFKIAGMLGQYKMGPCACGNDRENSTSSTWKFAEFPASQYPFGDIWHEYSTDVYFIFSICAGCGTIFGFSECT